MRLAVQNRKGKAKIGKWKTEIRNLVEVETCNFQCLRGNRIFWRR
jgi:hypothetical protein